MTKVLSRESSATFRRARLGRDTGALLRGARLADAEERLSNAEIPLSAIAAEFLGASIAARDAEQAKEGRRRAVELELARQLQEAAEDAL